MKNTTLIPLLALTFIIGLFLPNHILYAGQREQIISDELSNWESAKKKHLDLTKETSWEETVKRHQQLPKDLAMPRSYFSDRNTREKKRGFKIPKHQFDGGYQYFYAKYKEPNVMEQDGFLNGVYGTYKYRPGKDDLLNLDFINYYQADGMYASGDLDYEALTTTAKGLKIDKEDFMYELRGLFGKEYFMHPTYITLYTGFGYRYLNDDDDGTLHIHKGVGFYGYERTSNYYYVPVGFEILGEMSETWRLTIKGEFDFLVHGKQFSYFSDGDKFTSSPNQDLEQDQNDGYGIRGSIQLAKDFFLTTFSVEPFIRYWKIEDSKIVTAAVSGRISQWIEPENETLEIGAKLGLQFY